MSSTTNPLANLFGRSPFKPLQQHMIAAADCARLVVPLLEALCDGDQARVETIKEEIFQHEEKADSIKNELRAHLPKSLLMPVDRRDLLEVLQMQDSVADTTQDIAGLLVERQMEVPEVMKEPLLTLARRCVDTCDEAAKIIAETDELLEMGFRGRGATRVEEMADALNLIEDETDLPTVSAVWSTHSTRAFRWEPTPVPACSWGCRCEMRHGWRGVRWKGLESAWISSPERFSCDAISPP